MNAESIAKIIKERRQILDITQQTAAELSNVSTHTFSNVESAIGNPSIEILCRILDTLGMEMHIDIKCLGDKL